MANSKIWSNMFKRREHLMALGDTWNGACFLQFKVLWGFFFYHYITDETSFKEKSHLSHVSIYAIALVFFFYLWVRFYFHNKLLNLSFFVYCIQQHDDVRELMTLLQITQENMTLCCPRQYPNGFYTYVAKLIVKPSQLIVLECLKRHFWQEVFQ